MTDTPLTKEEIEQLYLRGCSPAQFALLKAAALKGVDSERLLNERDTFIVKTGLWGHFVDSLPPASKQEVAVSSEGENTFPTGWREFLIAAEQIAEQRGFEACREMAIDAVISHRFAYTPDSMTPRQLVDKTKYECQKVIRALTPNTDPQLPRDWLTKEVDAIGPETDKWPDGIKESFQEATKPAPKEAEPLCPSCNGTGIRQADPFSFGMESCPDCSTTPAKGEDEIELAPEDPSERRMFDHQAEVCGGPLAAVAAGLLIQSKMAPPQGSHAKTLAIWSNECAKAERLIESLKEERDNLVLEKNEAHKAAEHEGL